MIRVPRNVSWMKLRRHSHEWPNNDDGLPHEGRGRVQNVSTTRVESRPRFPSHATGGYVSLERQNKMDVYQLEGDARRAEAIYKKETLGMVPLSSGR